MVRSFPTSLALLLWICHCLVWEVEEYDMVKDEWKKSMLSLPISLLNLTVTVAPMPLNVKNGSTL
jgi:hypothetical protein